MTTQLRQSSNNHLLPSKAKLADNTSHKTILIAENIEYEIENQFIFKSPYIRKIKEKLGQNEGLRIILPKWVTKPSLENILSFLRTTQIPDISDCSETIIQRTLWLSDFLRLEDFQHIFIEKIIGNLKGSNSLVFLNESYNKLRTSEVSHDSWYKLFNYSVNTTAKNFLWNYSNKKSELLHTNDKIIEEIVERAFKYNQMHFQTDQKEIIHVLLHSRKIQDVFELLQSQRKLVLSKKLVNSPNQPNILWKLSNLKAIVEKETNAFKFGGFSWKLVAKMRKDEKGNHKLLFYLKFDSSLDKLRNDENFKNVSSNNHGILTIYFETKVNGVLLNKEIQIQSLNIEKNPYIKLYSLNHQEILQLSNRENEFEVNLNLESLYAAILVHISKNIERYHDSQTAGILNKNDLSVLLQNLPSNTVSNEHGLSLISTWFSISQNEMELEEVLKSLEWRFISLSSLTKALNSEAFRNSNLGRQLLEREISKKREETNRSSSNKDHAFRSFASEQQGRKVENSGAAELSREPLRSVFYSSQGSLPRGRFLNQSHQNVEIDQSRFASLQRESGPRAASLNTSLRSNNETASVPRILQHKTLATETSPSPNKILNSRVSLSPNKYYGEKSFEKAQEYYSKTFSNPYTSNPTSQNDLSSFDQKSGIQAFQSPTNTLSKAQAMLSDISSREGKNGSSGLALSSNKNAFNGQSSKAGFITPITSPTHNPNITNSMNFISNKDAFVSPLHERMTSGGQNTSELSSSFSMQTKTQEKRYSTTGFAFGSNLKARELSRGKERDSYSSDTSEMRRFNFEQLSIEEVREMYTSLNKSSQEKITKIRRALLREKENARNEIIAQLDLNNFAVNGKLEGFD